MNKAIYKLKQLIGDLFMVSEAESRAIMVGAWHQADSYGARAEAESFLLFHKQQAEREAGKGIGI